jgi:hypothetical protein
MSLLTFLDKLGADIVKVFTFAEHTAAAAEPFINVAFPTIAPLFDATLAAVQTSQAIAVLAGKASGSGPQKLALAISNITPVADAFFAAQGIKADNAVIEKWVNAFVALMQTIPAPVDAPATSTTTVTVKTT